MDFWWRPVSSSLFFFFLFLFLFFCAIVRPLTVAIAARRNGPFAATIIGCFYRAPFWFFFFFFILIYCKKEKKEKKNCLDSCVGRRRGLRTNAPILFRPFFFVPLETPKKYKKKRRPV